MKDDFKKAKSKGGGNCPCCHRLWGKNRKVLNRLARSRIKQADVRDEEIIEGMNFNGTDCTAEALDNAEAHEWVLAGVDKVSFKEVEDVKEI